eukprot:6357840-Prymnesium_polylepis.1
MRHDTFDATRRCAEKRSPPTIHAYTIRQYSGDSGSCCSWPRSNSRASRHKPPTNASPNDAASTASTAPQSRQWARQWSHEQPEGERGKGLSAAWWARVPVRAPVPAEKAVRIPSVLIAPHDSAAAESTATRMVLNTRMG